MPIPSGGHFYFSLGKEQVLVEEELFLASHFEKGTIIFSVPGCHIARCSLQNVLHSTYCNCHFKDFCLMLQLVNYHETCLWVGLEPTKL